MNVENCIMITPNKTELLDASDVDLLRSLKRNLAAEQADGGDISDRFIDSTLNIDSPRKENVEVLEMSKIIAQEKKKQQHIY